MNTWIPVAIADDQQLVRYAFSKKIEETHNFHILFEAENGKDLLERLKRAPRLPQICILDIGMPTLNGYDAMEVIGKKWPGIKVIVACANAGHYAISSMIKLGARGFFAKYELKDMVDALITTHENGYYYSDLAPEDTFKAVNNGKVEINRFTKTERKVFEYICGGMTCSKIAEALLISPRTLDKHLEHIYVKARVSSRGELITFAIANQLAVVAAYNR